MNRVWRGLAGVVLAGGASASLACGYCIEDKIAAVYDHGVVTRAVAQKHQVAFFALEGAMPSGENARRVLEAIANAAFGVDKGSARVSVESASLSVAFDPVRAPVVTLEHRLARGLATHGLSISVLRIMDSPARLKSVGQR